MVSMTGMEAPTKQAVLALYKSLLREGRRFSAYNYRKYAWRKVRDEFRVNKDLTDPNAIRNRYALGVKNLEILRRQDQVYEGNT
ncbi:unnamed protein product [Darwinula stevensoni]|uniref:Complex 1 LYR protein domain-containing protein n=1 Tax=Darwinula stevensoni TaxID=69355 RepID=A0A7R8X6G9_9CRUS|nr:unnamed protein product [Darwinula stevensoni]CAG0885764.1 unnamed protein product [Darwinula stevensoni]